VDTNQDGPCTLIRTSPDEARCLPPSNHIVLFSDAACTAPVAALSSTTCTPDFTSTVATLVDNSACPAIIRVFNVTAPIATPKQVFFKSQSSCLAESGSGLDFYAVSERPIADFAKVNIVRPK
jgi:hypothetical protein